MDRSCSLRGSSGRKRVRRLLLASLLFSVCAVAATPTSHAAPSDVEPVALTRARTIRSELSSRYLGQRLVVSEASSTAELASYSLLSPDALTARIVPADNGIYYAICPLRAVCPYAAPKLARPAADLVSRRLALELALRTFLTTSADLVTVSLPTSSYTLFVAQRAELERQVKFATLAKALATGPASKLTTSLANLVDRLTRPRVYAFLSLAPTPEGSYIWEGIPVWREGSAP
jgi:hypothetical protein